MSMLVAALMFIFLLALGIANLLWAAGRTWPIRNHELLAATVSGVPGVTRVPRLPALGMAAVTLGSGVAALALADHNGGGIGLTIVGVLLAALFIARGVLGYHPWWAARRPVEPFRTLDRRNYSPLALILGAGFAFLVVMRLL